MADRWIIHSEAVRIVHESFGVTLGRAEAILKRAKDSGEIRRRPDLVLHDDYTRPIPPAGPGEVEESDLRDWLTRNPIDTPPPTQQRVSAIKKIDAAKEGIAACFPGGVPSSVVNAVLNRRVGDWLKQNYAGLGDVSDDTIERAAGRK